MEHFYKGPWLDSVWPEDLDMRDPYSSLKLAMAATYSGRYFSTAVDVIAPLLVGAKHCSLLWERLLKAGIAARKPCSALNLAGLIVGTKFNRPDPLIRQLLNQVRTTHPALSDQPEFRRLDEWLRRHSAKMGVWLSAALIIC